jgi:hypothetical protein
MKASDFGKMNEKQLRNEIAKRFKFVFAAFDNKGKLMFVSDDENKLRLYAETQIRNIKGSVSLEDYEIRETVLI